MKNRDTETKLCVAIFFIALVLISQISSQNITRADAVVGSVSAGFFPVSITAYGTKLYVYDNLQNVSVVDTANNNSITSVPIGAEPSNFYIYGNKIYMPNGSNAFVSVLDTSNNSLSSFPAGLLANDIVLLAGKLFVTNTGEGTIMAFNPADNSLSTTTTVGGGPGHIVAVGTKIYATNNNNSISVVETSNSQRYVASSIAVGISPSDMLVLGTKIYITHGGGSNISIIDTSSGDSLTTLNIGGASTRIVSSGSKVYVLRNSGRVVAIDTANGNSITNITVGSNPSKMLISNGKMYVTNSNDNTVSIIDLATNTVINTLTVGTSPLDMALIGTSLYVVNVFSSNLSVIETETVPPVISSISAGTPLSTSAAVTWSTNESASSSILYGLTTSYGSYSHSSGTTAHSVSLSALAPMTTYHYLVVATDIAGNTTTGTDNTFTTAAGTATVMTNSVNPGALYQNATFAGSITSTGGADATQSGFAFSTSADLTTSVSTTSLGSQTGIASFSQQITTLSASTKYYIRAYATNLGGTGLGPIISFTTTAPPSSFVSSGGGSSSGSSAGASTPSAPTATTQPTVKTTPTPTVTPTPKITPASTPIPTVSPVKTVVKPSAAPQVKTIPLITPKKSPEISPKAKLAPIPTSTLTPISIVRTLVVGAEGADVKSLQEFLVSLKLGPSTEVLKKAGATGYFGQSTRDALVEYQKSRGIFPALGNLGPVTRDQLKKEGIIQ